MSEAALLPVLVDTLGWTLLHFLWQGLVLWILFALLMLVMRPASAAARYVVGMATLVAMSVAPIVTFIMLFETSVTTAVVTHGVVDGAAAADGWAIFVGYLETLLPWAVAAWLIGVTVLSGRIAMEYLRVRRLALEGVAPLSAEWQRIAESLRVSLGVRQAVRIMTSARVSVPMVVGWFRPLILIPPSALLGLTPHQLELIISHELAHVRRLDYLFNWVQIVVETLLFYHPGVRAVSTRVREEREHCCDDIVVRHGGDRLTYARALTEVAGLRCSAGMQVAVAATGGRLMGRVRRIVAMPGPQRGAAYWMTGLIFVAVLAAGSMTHLAELDGTVAIEVPVLPAAPSAAREPLSRADLPAVTAVPEPMRKPDPQSKVVSTLPVVDAVIRRAPQTLAAPPPKDEVTETPRDPDIAAVAPAIVNVVKPPARSEAKPAPSNNAPPPTPVAQSSAAISVVPPTMPVLARADAPAAAPYDAVATRLPSPPDARSFEAPRPVSASPAVTTVAEPPAMTEMPAAPETVQPVVAPEPPQAVISEMPPAATGGVLSKSVAPVYPRRARLEGISGSVRVRYVVDERGRVTDIEILSSDNGRFFERPVRKALKRWRYEPFAIEGVPVRQAIERSFDFGMEREQALVLAEAETGPCQKITGTRLCRSTRGYEDLAVSVVGETP